MVKLGFFLAGLGLVLTLFGAGTSDMAVEMGIPTYFDGLIIGAIGLALLGVGTIILFEKG
ncbi:MAG: hypothetical protein AAB627_02165 [Patescibacteria group bacterium]